MIRLTTSTTAVENIDRDRPDDPGTGRAGFVNNDSEVALLPRSLSDYYPLSPEPNKTIKADVVIGMPGNIELGPNFFTIRIYLV